MAARVMDAPSTGFGITMTGVVEKAIVVDGAVWAPSGPSAADLRSGVCFVVALVAAPVRCSDRVVRVWGGAESLDRVEQTCHSSPLEYEMVATARVGLTSRLSDIRKSITCLSGVRRVCGGGGAIVSVFLPDCGEHGLAVDHVAGDVG